MKINIADPRTGAVKKFTFTDIKLLSNFMDKRMAQDVDASCLGPDFEGYVLRITGGNDKQGFPMMQGVQVAHRVRLLLTGKLGCFRPRREGDRRRKSVRGCIIGPDLSVINTIIVKRGEKDIEGVTNVMIPARKGPKRANKIRKLFNLPQTDDVKKYVIRRDVERKRPKEKRSLIRSKAPKIQRLITTQRLNHKKQMLKKRKERKLLQYQRKKDYGEVMRKYLLFKKNNPGVIATIADTPAPVRKPIVVKFGEGPRRPRNKLQAPKITPPKQVQSKPIQEKVITKPEIEKDKAKQQFQRRKLL